MKKGRKGRWKDGRKKTTRRREEIVMRSDKHVNLTMVIISQFTQISKHQITHLNIYNSYLTIICQKAEKKIIKI